MNISNLTVFICIVSGPTHLPLREAVRGTWLRQCQDSRVCDHRFFIDVVESNVSSSLSFENLTFNDIVFRGRWCPFMIDRHHHLINYGNVMWGSSPDEHVLPDYQLRLMYKIDWKVCFLKWAQQNDRMASFLVFVEDDSFVCVGNLLHQLVILNTLAKEEGIINKIIPQLMTGTPTWHGVFDDSSTLMSRIVAEAFAEYYPKSGFNGSEMADATDRRKEQSWLSWGNSWMNGRCNWRDKLQEMFNISVIHPALHKVELTCGRVNSSMNSPIIAIPIKYGQNNSRHIVEVFDPLTTVLWNKSSKVVKTGHRRRLHTTLMCPHQGMIMHHLKAGELLLKDDNIAHMCEYMLFVDKVKNVDIMHMLWNESTRDRPNYHNFSVVLTRDWHSGWPFLRQSLEDKDRECSNETKPDLLKNCLAWRRDRIR